MYGNPGRLAMAAVVAISVGCALPIDGPVERQRAIDREDGDRLAGQLLHLPGVVAASVVLHRATRDPLATTPPTAAMLSAVISVDQPDPGAIRAAAVRLARAALPELAATEPAIEIHAAVDRAVLAKVGPFSVEESSRGPLKVVLVLGCLAIASLAGALARSARRHHLGNNAQ